MNEMAQAAAQVRSTGPEIVVVETGGPVESVERQSNAVRYGKWAGLLAIPLAVGVAVGQIGTNAGIYNKTIDDAAVLADDVKAVRASLVQLQVAVQDAQSDLPKLVTNRKQLIESLKGVQLHRADIEKVYGSYMYELDDELVSATLEFYTLSTQVMRDVKRFIEQTERDEPALKAGADKKEGATPEADDNTDRAYRYGVYIYLPKKDSAGDKPGIKLVELGRPLCPPDGKPNDSGRCPGAVPSGYEFRENPDFGWSQMNAVGPAGPAPEVILPILQTGTFESMIKGGESALAEGRFLADFQSLAERLDGLIQLGSGVESRLKAKAAEGHKFSFGL